MPAASMAAECSTGGTPIGVTGDEAADGDADVLSPLRATEVNV